jgi:hypothetical protein
MVTAGRAFERLRHRTLAEAGLAGPVVEEFKRDDRSVVWRVERAGGPRVVKRFVYAPLRQRLSLLVGRHPGQAELKWNRALRGAGVPVVPVVDGGIEPAGLGATVWLATPLAGASMQRLIREEATRRTHGEALISAAADLTRALFAAGFWSRDLKPSNIVIDDDGRALLIDVGSARHAPAGPAAAATTARTLAVMDRVLARDGVDEPLRRRYAQLVAGAAKT